MGEQGGEKKLTNVKTVEPKVSDQLQRRLRKAVACGVGSQGRLKVLSVRPSTDGENSF